MTTRAKFRCHSIKLQQSSRIKPDLQYDGNVRAYRDRQGNEVAAGDAYEQWDQPTVELYAVTPDGNEENAHFFAATPSARVELTISNPDAAETFELGKFYYVDFSPAE